MNNWEKILTVQGYREMYKLLKKNKQGESLVVELIYNNWAKQGKKKGSRKRIFIPCINATTYVTDKDGVEHNRDLELIPWIYRNDDKFTHTRKIDFDKILPVSEENIEKVLAEIEDRFLAL